MSVSSMSTRPRSSSSTSYATTPEPSSPSLSGYEDDDCLPLPTAIPLAPFQPTSYYDESLLPVLPSSDIYSQARRSSASASPDAGTPDHWIARDDRMVRLTGRHPFNAEPPLSSLFSSGFLTPQNLFHVRNHGAVPKVSPRQARDWRLRVHGLVHREVSLSIEDLKQKFETVTLPVTLVCAGNRRKEQNMVAKGLGFNWGAAGVSTGLFTGVYLADILEYCGVRDPLLTAYPSYDTVIPGRARHVIFEGADELPKGRYGTSQRLSWAADRSKGMIVAWGLNGEDLSPDHGFPLRLVVPGQVGGRMVKWLQRIEVSDHESHHHLHYFDNKVLPTQVSADQARHEDSWWYDPKYILNEVNVNAAVCYPDHDHLLQVASGQTERQILPVQGYAYTGGGRRIARVEVTLDDGHTWQLANVTYPEDLYRLYPVRDDPYFGTLDLSTTDMSFAWCFWRLDLDVQTQLLGRDVKCIAVRAMDESLQVMPRDMYWNATSMMNSWWFRVAVHKDIDTQTLRFEHPAPVAGSNTTGWMQRMKEAGLDPRYPDFSVSAPETTSTPAEEPKEDVLQEMLNPDKMSTIITMADLAPHAHIDAEEPWFIVHGHVYDGTPFLATHPGGAESIRLVAGQDATEDFLTIHSVDTKRMMRDFHLGRLEGPLETPVSSTEADSGDFLGAQWKKTHLVSKETISHDARMFRFALSHEDQRLGLPVGQHVHMRVKKTDKATGQVTVVQRAYTPYSGDAQRGYLDILIKVYFRDGSFAGGKMTTMLEDMPVGVNSDNDDVEWTVELKGPSGRFTYLGRQQVQWKPAKEVRRVKHLAMVAGGSGITPMLSTLKAIATEYVTQPRKSERVQVSLVYGNRTEEDVLAREELDHLVRVMNGDLKVWHVLSSDKVSPDWAMGRGHIDTDCLRTHLVAPPARASNGETLEDTLVLVCGPPAMEAGVRASLEQLGWDTERTAVFF